MRFILPLLVFVVISGFLYSGLGRDPTYVPSPFIGKPAPQFKLPTLHDPDSSFSTEQMTGKVWLLNIWATWCASCRVEHPVLVDLAQRGQVDIVGLNYKDEDDKAISWLQQLGDPYQITAVDSDGRIGIDWGLYGAPETFVIDAEGTVRLKHVGPVSFDDLEKTIMPLVAKLQSEGS